MLYSIVRPNNYQDSLRLMRLCHPYLKGDGVVINLGTGAAYRQDSGRYGAYRTVGSEAIDGPAWSISGA